MFVAPVLLAIVTGVLVPLLLRAANQDESASSHLAVAGLTADSVDQTNEIVLTVSNPTQEVAVVGRVDFRVLTSRRLVPCGTHVVNDSQTEITGSYDLFLPPEDGDDSARVDTRQKIQVNDADSFRFVLRGDRPTRIYQLAVLVYHDGEAEPLESGNVIVIAPFHSAAQYFRQVHDVFPQSKPCLKRNIQKLDEILSLGRAHSRDLTHFAEG